MGLITVLILFFSLKYENRRRDHLYGPIITVDSKANLIPTQTDVPIIDTSGIGTEEERRRWGYEHMTEEEIRDLGDKHATWRYII